MGEIKQVAQVGAVIGREFSQELLAATITMPEPQLAAALDRLLQGEIIFRRGVPPNASYVFKHALVQDAAYQSLLKSRRQQLHARIAEVIAKRFPALVELAAASPGASLDRSRALRRCFRGVGAGWSGGAESGRDEGSGRGAREGAGAPASAPPECRA